MVKTQLNLTLNKSYCDTEIEVNVTKTSSTFCTLPMMNLYYFGKNPSVGFRDHPRIEFIDLKVSKLMKIGTFS